MRRTARVVRAGPPAPRRGEAAAIRAAEIAAIVGLGVSLALPMMAGHAAEVAPAPTVRASAALRPYVSPPPRILLATPAQPEWGRP